MQVVARGRDPLCHPCLHDQLLGKARSALRINRLIRPGDAVAVAFSGGPSSAALLHFLGGMRDPQGERLTQGLVHFTQHIIHVDESSSSAGSEASGCELRPTSLPPAPRSS